MEKYFLVLSGQNLIPISPFSKLHRRQSAWVQTWLWSEVRDLSQAWTGQLRQSWLGRLIPSTPRKRAEAEQTEWCHMADTLCGWLRWRTNPCDHPLGDFCRQVRLPKVRWWDPGINTFLQPSIKLDLSQYCFQGSFKQNKMLFVNMLHLIWF